MLLIQVYLKKKQRQFYKPRQLSEQKLLLNKNGLYMYFFSIYCFTRFVARRSETKEIDLNSNARKHIAVRMPVIEANLEHLSFRRRFVYWSVIDAPKAMQLDTVNWWFIWNVTEIHCQSQKPSAYIEGSLKRCPTIMWSTLKRHKLDQVCLKIVLL